MARTCEASDYYDFPGPDGLGDSHYAICGEPADPYLYWDSYLHTWLPVDSCLFHADDTLIPVLEEATP